MDASSAGKPVLVRVVVVVELGGDVDDERRLGAHRREAVVDARRDDDHALALPADDELVGLAVGGRALARVVQHDLGHAADAHEVVGLQLVVVPRLDHARVDHGHVDLPELLEVRVVAAKHLHEQPALIGHHLEVFDLHAIDHDAILSEVSVRSHASASGDSYLPGATVLPQPPPAVHADQAQESRSWQNPHGLLSR